MFKQFILETRHEPS